MNRKLIALYSSQPRMGKTAAAYMLVKHCGFKRVSFAAPLRDMVRVYLRHLGYPPEEMAALLTTRKNRPLIGPGGRAPRYLLQTLGTEWGRTFIDTDVWLDIALYKISRLQTKGYNVVVDDMRFLNEYYALRAAGAETWRIHRPLKDTPETHTSEGGLDRKPFDVQLHNVGSLKDLQRMVAGRMLTKQPCA